MIAISYCGQAVCNPWRDARRHRKRFQPHRVSLIGPSCIVISACVSEYADLDPSLLRCAVSRHHARHTFILTKCLDISNIIVVNKLCLVRSQHQALGEHNLSCGPAITSAISYELSPLQQQHLVVASQSVSVNSRRNTMYIELLQVWTALALYTDQRQNSNSQCTSPQP